MTSTLLDKFFRNLTMKQSSSTIGTKSMICIGLRSICLLTHLFQHLIKHIFYISTSVNQGLPELLDSITTAWGEIEIICTPIASLSIFWKYLSNMTNGTGSIFILLDWFVVTDQWVKILLHDFWAKIMVHITTYIPVIDSYYFLINWEILILVIKDCALLWVTLCSIHTDTLVFHNFSSLSAVDIGEALVSSLIAIVWV